MTRSVGRATMNELTILQAVRLKGRITPDGVAATLNEDRASLMPAITELIGAGMLMEGKTVRLSPAGRDRLDELLTAERRGIDNDAISAAYQDFRAINPELKTLVSDWQLKDGEPNDHEDAEYDSNVLARLHRVHDSVLPIIAAVAAQVPRMSAYAAKLSAALEKIGAGDTTWFTRPMVDSYHTVWFELHEELILAAGLTREEEAITGGAH